MRTLLTVFWLRQRLAFRGLVSIAGAANLIAGLALALLAALGALALAAGLGLVLHLAILSSDPDTIQLTWTVILYTITFIAVFVPLITGAGSSAFDPSHLLVFPVGRGTLHRITLTSEFLSASHLVWYPVWLVAAVVGILIPGPHRLVQLTVISLLAVTLVVWAHAAMLVVRRWLRNRRLKELAAVIGLGFVVLMSLAPAAIDITVEDADQRLEELFTIPPWIERAAGIFPPSITSRALRSIRTDGPIAGLGRVGWLVGWLAAGWIMGRFAFDGLLRSGTNPTTTAVITRESRLGRVRTQLIDRLPPPVGAVTSKELRYLLQSGTGRISLLVMPVMTALPAVLSGRHGGMIILGLDLQLAVFLGVMMYAAALTGYLQVNAFAWEKTGVATTFTSPVAPEAVLLGKNMGVWILNLVLGAEGLLVWGIVRGLPPISTIATGLLVLATTSVLLSLLGNFTSVAFPESRPVSALTSAASPTGTLVMIGCLLVGAAVGGVVCFGAAAMTVPVLQPVLALAVFSTIAAAYRMSLSPAARAFSEHRDQVFRALGVN